MRCISLYQPWASLIAAGFKRVETRSWKPFSGDLQPGDDLAIHAGKHWTQDEVAFSFHPLVYPLLREAERAGLWSFDAPPRGAIVALATFDGAVAVAGNYLRLSPMERLLGNYGAGRRMWRLSNVRPITPIPLNGRQRLFEWDTAGAFIQPLEPVADDLIAERMNAIAVATVGMEAW